MNVSLFNAAAAINATSRWQESIAENLAASAVPGFKKQEFSFESIRAGLMAVPGAGSRDHVLPRGVTATNFSQGALRPTGVKTDLAIEGGGFFAVQLPNGATAYTRAGEFHISSHGQLVTKEGYPVLGEAGPIQLDPNLLAANPPAISPTGQISQGAAAIGKIRLVEFNDSQLLTPTGGGYFVANHPNLLPQNAVSSSLRQGVLEAANTSTPIEMVNLISATRMFEANQRVIQMQDERMGRVITELGGLG